MFWCLIYVCSFVDGTLIDVIYQSVYFLEVQTKHIVIFIHTRYRYFNFLYLRTNHIYQCQKKLPLDKFYYTFCLPSKHPSPMC